MYNFHFLKKYVRLSGTGDLSIVILLSPAANTYTLRSSAAGIATNLNISGSYIAVISKALLYRSTPGLSSIYNPYIPDSFSPDQPASF